jgi:hypothetical protein
MKPLTWIDQRLWLVPLLVFLLGELGLGVWSAVSSTPVLLAAAPPTARQAVYTSLTGSFSAILGIALATVAILVAFGPRPDRYTYQGGTRSRTRPDNRHGLAACREFLHARSRDHGDRRRGRRSETCREQRNHRPY